MREFLRRRWVLGTAVLVVVLAVGVAALLITRVLSRNPWPTTDRDYDACTLVAPDDFGVFRSVQPLADLFDAQGPTLVSHSVEPMETSGELGESCVYSSEIDSGAPRFQVKMGPTMSNLPEMDGMEIVNASQGELESFLYRPTDGKGYSLMASLGNRGIVEVSAIDFPTGLKNEGPKWSRGVDDFATDRTIVMANQIVKRLNVHALPLAIAEGSCRKPDDADVQQALGKKATFSRSVNRDDYDYCAYTADNGTRLTARVERGSSSSSRPPGDGWDEVDGTPNTYQHDNRVAVLGPKHRAVAYVEVTSPDDETQEREPGDLAVVGKKLLAGTGGS